MHPSHLLHTWKRIFPAVLRPQVISCQHWASLIPENLQRYTHLTYLSIVNKQLLHSWHTTEQRNLPRHCLVYQQTDGSLLYSYAHISLVFIERFWEKLFSTDVVETAMPDIGIHIVVSQSALREARISSVVHLGGALSPPWLSLAPLGDS